MTVGVGGKRKVKFIGNETREKAMRVFNQNINVLVDDKRIVMAHLYITCPHTLAKPRVFIQNVQSWLLLQTGIDLVTTSRL